MDLLKILEEVVHPALGEKNIVELGMVDGVVEKDGKVEVTLGFPKKPDPLKDYLVGATKGLRSR